MRRLLAGLLLAAMAAPLDAYSVLSHEALIDALWDPVVVPLLQRRFPNATPAELNVAHGFAYGGCVVQDLGYYPFGNRFFSDLAHYARTGDFVVALVNEARTVDEYAFALGALSHYVADNVGHPLAVNLAVAQMYPKLRSQFGDNVTYANSPRAHVITEFSFDVVQITGAGYLPRTFHSYIGFHVARDLLERGFQKTYGLRLSDMFFWERLSLAVYRVSAGEIVPSLGYGVWRREKKKLLRLDPQLVTTRFKYKLASGNFLRPVSRKPRSLKPWNWHWADSAKRANGHLGGRIVAALIGILPKVGPLSTLKFRAPTFPVQSLFIDSFDESIAGYEYGLGGVSDPSPVLPEVNLDTGDPSGVGSYDLADRTYARWLHLLAKHRFRDLSPGVRENILKYYANAQKPFGAKTLAEVERLRLR
ncbi:MAG: zinc dependent phospholipase C family protein [Bryobacteraceae bacterium]